MADNSSAPPEGLVNSVMEITGSSETEATYLLGACGNSVEAAVSLFFENGVVPVAGSASPGVSTEPNNGLKDDEDDVRAPIAPFREQLIGPGEDNFAGPSTNGAAGNLMARVNQRVKICPLRDFAREGMLMEEQMMQAASTAGGISDGITGQMASDNRSSFPNVHGWTANSRRAAHMLNAASNIPRPQGGSLPPQGVTSQLGDLFRPPTDIAYHGTFQMARMRGVNKKQWLLVNVQNEDFNSQVLNRDIWSNKHMRQLIKKHFVLWQVEADSSEGRRFIAFYHCANIPYVCLIDPRTGEEVWKCTKPDESLLGNLKKFLRGNKDFSEVFDENAPSTSKRTNIPKSEVSDDANDETNDDASISSSAANTKLTKRSKLMELSEEEQIALAIRNSMKENGKGTKTKTSLKALVKSNMDNVTDTDSHNTDDQDDYDDSEIDSVEEFMDDDTKSTCEKLSSYEDLLGKSEEMTMIKLRVLKADESDEIIVLRWPSDTPLKALRAYIAQCQKHVHNHDYRIICAFPQKSLSAECDTCTLKELGLHPSANLHVTWD